MFVTCLALRQQEYLIPNDEFERQVMMKGNLQETLVRENTLSTVSNAASFVPTVRQYVWTPWVAAEHSIEVVLLSGIDTMAPRRASTLEAASKLSTCDPTSNTSKMHPEDVQQSRVNNMLKLCDKTSVIWQYIQLGLEHALSAAQGFMACDL